MKNDKINDNQIQIKQNQNTMNQSLQSSGLSSIQLKPVQSQWGLINDYKVLQIQRQKQRHQAMKRQRQRSFKDYLDQQVDRKKQQKIKEKQKEMNYYDQVLKQDENLLQKEIEKKNNQFHRYKNFQQDNQYLIRLGRNSRLYSDDGMENASFDIGSSTLQKQKQKKIRNRKQIVDSLDKQVYMKAQQKQLDKQYNLELDHRRLKYQLENQIGDKEKNPRYFSQNQKVFDHLEELNRQKYMKERQVDRLLINKANKQKMQEQERKLINKKQQKAIKNMEVKEYLDFQVNYKNRKVHQQNQTNPQQHSYSVLGGLFRQRPSPYDKKQYSQYLRHQAEQKKSKQRKIRYMNQQQYKLNMNQLNKAINGSYTHNDYLDRSIDALGDDDRVKGDHLKMANNNSNFVKMNLEHLKESSIRK